MKKLLTLTLMVALLSGCTTSTQYGSCIGVADDKDPKLLYKISVWNTVMAIFFFETIVVPIVVIVNEIACPEGIKQETPK